MTLPHYNMPPLTPHKPTPQDAPYYNLGSHESMISAWRSSGCRPANLTHVNCGNQPTPTIPQMEDQHERQVFTDKAECVINKALAFALTVLAVVFVGGLMYKTFVWGH